jgi:hypothetical protein
MKGSEGGEVPTDSAPKALIADDGELTEVRSVLRDVEVEFAERQGNTATGDDLPNNLLVSTPQYAMTLERLRQQRAPESRPLHLVVTGDLSRTLQSALERSSCDIVVAQPVDPSALRLLILRSLYQGTKKRRFKRVAISADVMIRVGRGKASASLAQLSLRGCGLVSQRAADVGEPVSVILPGSLTGSGRLTLDGRVVGARPVHRGAKGSHELAVFFDALDATGKQAVRELIDNHAVVGAILNDASGEEPTGPRSEGQPGRSSASGHSVRRSPRKLFARHVLAGLDGDSMTLIGRDLSSQGMRVKPDPSLRLGDELKLALYGRAGIPPVAIRAVATRDDGDAGWYLRFRAVSKASEARLEKLMESLPLLTSKPPDTPERPGVVVSEVLERR